MTGLKLEKDTLNLKLAIKIDSKGSLTLRYSSGTNDDDILSKCIDGFKPEKTKKSPLLSYGGWIGLSS
jgi:hypothetical protein